MYSILEGHETAVLMLIDLTLGVVLYAGQYSRNNQNMHLHILHLTSVRVNFWVTLSELLFACFK